MPIDKKTFCIAPWYSVFIDQKKRIAPCCKFKELQDKPIEQYYKSEQLEQVRNDLLNGVKNKNCAKCWSDEENGGDSLRLISNRTIAHGKNLNIAKQIEDPQLDKILSFDIVLGNLCNLKCVMCGPECSSQLLSEANTNPDIKSLYSKATNYEQKTYNWPKEREFMEWCNRHLSNAIHIKFTGGEPFIIPWIEEVLSKIPEAQKSKCILHFTSNLTVVNSELFKHFHEFKEVWISISVEGIEQTFEYIRHGHSWSKFKENISAVMQMEIPNLILKINHVIQAPSFHSIPKMVEYFDSMEIEIHPIQLNTPKHFMLQSLTERCKQDFLKNTADYKGFNHKFMSFVKNVVTNNMAHNTLNTEQMIKHLKMLESLRKNDYQKIIPIENISAE